MIATRADLDDAVVVYPEIIPGNPLRGAPYLRWLLYKPGGPRRSDASPAGCTFTCFQGVQHRLRGHALRRRTARGGLDGRCLRAVEPVRGRAFVDGAQGKTRPDLPRPTARRSSTALNHVRLARVFNAGSACYFYDPTAFSGIRGLVRMRPDRGSRCPAWTRLNGRSAKAAWSNVVSRR